MVNVLVDYNRLWCNFRLIYKQLLLLLVFWFEIYTIFDVDCWHFFGVKLIIVVNLPFLEPSCLHQTLPALIT